MEIKRTKDRIDKTGEIFTPKELVNEILDKFPDFAFTDENKTFCDPACGDGNFLIEILLRKLKNGHNIHKALSTIYGVDIMDDNVELCKSNLLKIVGDNEENRKIVYNNIVCYNSLNYDWCFNGNK